MTCEQNRIGVIVLAAGASSRLGSPKQLLPFNGRPLLQHTIDLVNRLENVISLVVLGANADKILSGIHLGSSLVMVNRDWPLGMACSISAGLIHLKKMLPNIEYVLFVVGDQPYLSYELLEKLICAANQGEHPVIASTYNGEVGVPALFHRRLFAQLSKLKGDEGAKKIIRNNIDHCGLVTFLHGEVDIDTPADYETLIAAQNSSD